MWADRQWTMLDGLLQQKGIDIYERQAGPAWRFVALLHSMYVLDVLPWIDDEGTKKEITRLLEWPTIAAERELEESTQQAVKSLEAAGFDPSVVMRQFGNADAPGVARPQ